MGGVALTATPREGIIGCKECRKIGKMEKLLQRFWIHITLAKVICLALLFSPLWGLWWFHIDTEVPWVLQLMIGYRFLSLRAGVVYPSVCFLAFLGFVIVTFLRAPVV